MTETTIKPLGDRVVVRRLKDDETGTTSVSGIIIPDTVTKEKPEQGIVIAVGEGRWDEDGEKRSSIRRGRGCGYYRAVRAGKLISRLETPGWNL